MHHANLNASSEKLNAVEAQLAHFERCTAIASTCLLIVTIVTYAIRL